MPDLIMEEAKRRTEGRDEIFMRVLEAISDGSLSPSPNPPEPYPKAPHMAKPFAFRWPQLVRETIDALCRGARFPNWAPWHWAVMLDQSAFENWAIQNFERRVKSRPPTAKIEESVAAIFRDARSRGEADPTATKVDEIVRATHPNVTRQQVRDAINGQNLQVKRGRPKKSPP